MRPFPHPVVKGGLPPVWLAAAEAHSACISNSTGLIYPIFQRCVRTVVALDAFENIILGLVVVRFSLRAVLSVFNVEKRASIAASFHTLPAAHAAGEPAIVIEGWNCALAYRLPRSE